MSHPVSTVPTPVSTVHTPAGIVTLEPLVLGSSTDSTDSTDALRTLHAWLDHPGSVYWGMRGSTPSQVEEFLVDWSSDPHRRVLIVRIDGLRVGLAVFYDPAEVELDGRYPHEPGDFGMHLLVAPTRTPVPGTTAAVMGAICSTAFAVPVSYTHLTLPTKA